MKSVVLTFDRLPVSFLGCYGNMWIETEHFDRLAAESVVFDQHFGEFLDPQAVSPAWSTGRSHVPETTTAPSAAEILPDVLRSHGVKTTLLVECPANKPVSLVDRFDEVIEVHGSDGLDVDAKEMPFPRLVEKADECLHQLAAGKTDSWLLWLKSRGVPVPWIPPRDLATFYLDLLNEDDDEEDDEEALWSEKSESVEIARALGDLSADERDSLIQAVGSPGGLGTGKEELSPLEWRVARSVYAGYVSLLDAWFGKLHQTIQETVSGDDLLLIVTAAAGESLGECAGLVKQRPLLAEEAVHTPLFVRVPGGEADSRRQALVQTIDLVPTLLDWHGIDAGAMPVSGSSLLPVVRGELASIRDRICMQAIRAGRSARVIRTADYRLHVRDTETSGVEAQQQLFVKPDDIWDINDVAAQDPDVVARLSSQLDAWVQAEQDGR